MTPSFFLGKVLRQALAALVYEIKCISPQMMMVCRSLLRRIMEFMGCKTISESTGLRSGSTAAEGNVQHQERSRSLLPLPWDVELVENSQEGAASSPGQHLSSTHLRGSAFNRVRVLSGPV